jgi:hypothetical protein
MRKYLPIYEDEEAFSHIWHFNCSILNSLIYGENLIFFFISVPYKVYICDLFPKVQTLKISQHEYHSYEHNF